MHFPILVAIELDDKTTHVQLCENAEDVPSGIVFKVIATKVSHLTYSINRTSKTFYSNIHVKG